MNGIYLKQTHSRLAACSRTRLASGRSLHSSHQVLAEKVPQDTLSQGHATGKTGSAKDVHAEYVKAGMQAKESSDGQVDATSRNRDLKAHSLDHDKSGNPEGVGFEDQVGSQSASADARSGMGSTSDGRKEERDEEAATPGLFSTIKSKLRVGTDAGDVKQNRGGGRGLSGTGTTTQTRARGLHSSAAMDPSPHSGGVSSSDVRKQALGSGKDRPSPVDYMKDVLQDTPGLPSKRPHNLGNCRGYKHADATTPNPLFNADKTVSSPKRHPRLDAAGVAEIHEGHDGVGKPSGEWSVAGHASSEYSNMSAQDDPYESPSDDTDAATKEDSRAKKLRYG